MTSSNKKSAKVVKLKPKTKTLTVVEQPPRSMEELIWRALKDKSIDVAKMREIIALQQQQKERVAKEAFYEKLAAAQNAIGVVLRDARNPHTKSNYVRLETLSQHVDPIIHEHGFSLSYDMTESNLPNHYRIVCTVSNSGHSRDYWIDLPADTSGPEGKPNKTLVQGVGSSVAYGRRNLKVMIFDIRIADQDDDGNRGLSLPIDATQLATVEKLIAEVKANRSKLLDLLHINKLEEMPVSMLGRTLTALEQMRHRTPDAG